MSEQEDMLVKTAGQFSQAWGAIQNMILTLPKTSARDRGIEALDLAKLWTKEALVTHFLDGATNVQGPPQSESPQQGLD